MNISFKLTTRVRQFFSEQWTQRDGQKVPEPEELRLGNDAVQLEGVVLYADLSDSTGLVNNYKPAFAARIYKAYLHCAGEVIRGNNGRITAYDGDRVMAVFTGSAKNSSAAKAGLQINHCVYKIINPLIGEFYPRSDYKVDHAVGVAASKLWIARTGVWGANDLTWVGSSANYAAKMCGIRNDAVKTWLTKSVYNSLNSASKRFNGQDMWKRYVWNEQDSMPVYGSSWIWCP